MLPVRCSSTSGRGLSCPAAPTGMQIREGQHAPTVVAQSDAGVIEVGARHVNAHVRAGTILGASVASSSAGHGQSPPPRRVGCDPSPCHRGSWRRDSCLPSPHDPSRTSNPSPSRSSRSCPSCPSSRSSPWPGRTRHGPCPHHAAHHVVHGQPFDRIEGRHGSLKTFTHGQRGTRVACPVHRLGEDRVSVIPWLDDHVDGFARTESELIDGHRLHVNTIDAPP